MTTATEETWGSIAVMYDAIADVDDVGEEYERVVRRVYEQVLRPGDVAIDVGAHVGKHTLPMGLAVEAAGGVIAVEPIPWAIARLANRVEGAGLWSRIIPLHACCGRSEDSVDFSIVPDHPGWSARHVRTKASAAVPISLPQFTIDTIGSACGPIRFIKIDVEGAEPDVLAGARTVLATDRPVVHVEIAAESLDAHGYDASDVREPLVSAGYEIYDLLGTNLSDPVLFLRSVGHQSLIDYIAVHRDDPRRQSVIDVLRLSFTALGRAGRGALSARDSTRSATRHSTSLRERFVPNSELARVMWPKPSEEAAAQLNTIVFADAGPGNLVLGPSTSVALNVARSVYVPVDSSRFVLGPRSSVVVALQVSVRPSAGYQTLFEIRLSDAGLQGIVRLTPDQRVQLFWTNEGRSAPSRYIRRMDEHVDITISVERRDQNLRLRARAGTAVADATTKGEFVEAVSAAFSIGRRRAWRSADAMPPSAASIRARLIDTGNGG